jgi:myo-inositol 2-dehydrogenase/D-chiro-inositol 1-dehydrogenase
LQVVKEAKVPLMLAFNQRLDPNFAEVKLKILEGKVGKLHTVHIISRDPAPPPISFIMRSGGLFMDMTIHDFDMANYLVDAEVLEVYAKGYNLFDPEIGKAGDIDTGIVMITFKNNVTVMIENSRKATYGYDQRLEVFGSSGMIRVENPLKSTNTYSNEEGSHLARNPDFFMDRYKASYFQEMKIFVESLLAKKPMPITGEDGLKAMLVAAAANLSLKENRAVLLKEIEKYYLA